MTDDEETLNHCIGTGAASTTDRRRPSRDEKREIAHKQPIGFVHFAKPAAPRKPRPRIRPKRKS